MMVASCAFNTYFLELKEKKEFFGINQNRMLQKDLKRVLQVMPEGLMVFKRFGNPHIKLWNKEIERLFAFK